MYDLPPFPGGHLPGTFPDPAAAPRMATRAMWKGRGTIEGTWRGNAAVGFAAS